MKTQPEGVNVADDGGGSRRGGNDGTRARQLCESDRRSAFSNIERHHQHAKPYAGGAEDIRCADVAASLDTHVDARATGEQKSEGHRARKVPDDDGKHQANRIRNNGSYVEPLEDTRLRNSVALVIVVDPASAGIRVRSCRTRLTSLRRTSFTRAIVRCAE